MVMFLQPKNNEDEIGSPRRTTLSTPKCMGEMCHYYYTTRNVCIEPVIDLQNK